MKVSVCCPSYRRPKKVETADYLPFVKVYIDKSEEVVYRENNPNLEIKVCPDGVQGNLCRVRNYILKNEFQEGADAVLIVDDDLMGVFYFEKLKKHKIETKDFLNFIERYSMLAKEWGVKFWGLNVNSDKQCYREYSPFSTLSYIGGPFQCFLRGNECLYDERLPLKEDYDMTLQQLNKYRKVLRLNKYYYVSRQAEQAGGCAVYRNLDREMKQFRMLQKKWGSKIVKRDKNDRCHKSTKIRRVDINPVITIPIAGI